MDSLITADWLAANIHHTNVKVLDCTWVLPGDESGLAQGYIPGAHIFDIDRISDLTSQMKHTLPAAEVFAKAVSDMGLSNNDHIIFYDRHGVFSSPRVWWTFMTFGHEKVSILDGGLTAWIKAGRKVENKPIKSQVGSTFETAAAHIAVVKKRSVLEALDKDVQIIDARPEGRFYGREPEPRAGLRSGHIPGSYSLPYGSLKTTDGHFRPLPELAEIVGATGIDLNKPIITSCGSGITAAGLAFTLHRLGAKDISVYDGSWAEWGASDLPIEI